MPSQPQQKKHTISSQAGAILIVIALLFDVLQAAVQYANALPVIGTIAVVIFTTLLNVWAYLTIWFAFKLVAPEISFMKPKRALALNGGLLIELIPILNALPAWTLATVVIIMTTRGEEALVNTLEKTAGVVGAAGKVAGAASKIPGMNKNLKEGLQKTSEGAKNTSEFAREKAKQIQGTVWK